MGKALDLVDGGYAATFTNGPKKGHVGVVTPDGDQPPKSLTFLEDLIYVRDKPCKVRAYSALEERAVTYRGVSYRVDPRCGFMVRVKQAVTMTAAERDAGRLETT